MLTAAILLTPLAIFLIGTFVFRRVVRFMVRN